MQAIVFYFLDILNIFIQKVEHGCAVATVGGSRGVVVVGGATGDDVVEFLDWEIKQQWKVLGINVWYLI